MKIAFISTMDGFPWGGSEELWSRAAARFREQGLETAALVKKWPSVSKEIDSLIAKGVRVSFLDRTSLVGRSFARLLRQGPSSAYLRYLRKCTPDFVVVSQGVNGDGIHCMLACAELDIPYAAIVHANCESWWPTDEIRDDWLRAYRLARCVFFVSRNNAEVLEDQLGIELTNKAIVWNPWNVRTDKVSSWPAAGDEIRLACVARLDVSAKGQDVLLRALARLASATRQIHVSFFGSGAYAIGLGALADRLGLSGVSFEGHVSDINEIWNKHHMLVLPSRFEGMPITLVEAMWCGRPAIVTDVGGNAELCEDNVTGFVCPAPKVSLLADTLERAWEARAQWPEMGAAARKKIEAIAPRDPIASFCSELLNRMH
jgi:glycosyltransferase involved in cell wall biosynthesis